MRTPGRVARRARASASALLAAFLLAAPSLARAASYATEGTCVGFPRIDLVVPSGWCLALVADASNGLAFPCRVLEVAPGRFWLVDMGSWEPRRGRLLQFDLPVARQAGPVAMTVIATSSTVRSASRSAPTGASMSAAGHIWRTKVALPIAPETVLDHLPDDGAHPLKEIAFAPGARMFVSVGSSSDACRDAKGELPMPCPDLIGANPRAAVYEVVLGGAAFTVQSFRPNATGLRNSLALAWVTTPGVLLQGENSVDYPDEEAPAEELNRIVAGASYGWPYCVGARRVARGYEGRFDCTKTEAPALLWPAHAAPLQMVAVPANANNAFADQLVVAWHGYRAGGHRIASFALDATGRPTGPARLWIDGWAARGKGHPLGAPAGFTVDRAGRLLVVEDRNRALLMLVRDPATNAPAATIR